MVCFGVIIPRSGTELAAVNVILLAERPELLRGSKVSKAEDAGSSSSYQAGFDTWH